MPWAQFTSAGCRWLGETWEKVGSVCPGLDYTGTLFFHISLLGSYLMEVWWWFAAAGADHRGHSAAAGFPIPQLGPMAAAFDGPNRLVSNSI